jgi:hypothetical protein
MSTTIAAFASKMEQLDALMREIYGCSCDEFLNDSVGLSFNRGLYDGYRLGNADGRRAAKGQKLDPKGRGRPPVMEKGLTALMVYHVHKARADKKK